MLNPTAPDGALCAAMSSLMDGDLGGDLPGDALAQAMGAWRARPQARAAWHTYHLIGDVLRSDDLANPPGHDAAFLQALRIKLAQEPVPLAPQAAVAAYQAPAAAAGMSQVGARGGRSRAGWLVAPAAVAAGFVAVAGLLVANRVVTLNPQSSGQLAGNNAADSATVLVTVAPAASGALVRNVSLDRYLEAHRSLSNGVVAAGAAEHRVQIVFESK